jgi:hypothetical protein
MKGRFHLRDLGIDGSIILKWNLEKNGAAVAQAV